MENYNIDQLPVEILLIIFQFLDVKDLYRIRQVNHLLQQIADDNNIWQSLFHSKCKTLGSLLPSSKNSETPIWRYIYGLLSHQEKLKEKEIESLAKKLIWSETSLMRMHNNLLDERDEKEYLERKHCIQEKQLEDANQKISGLEAELRYEKQYSKMLDFQKCRLQFKLEQSEDRLKSEESITKQLHMIVQEDQKQLQSQKDCNKLLKKEIVQVQDKLEDAETKLKKESRCNERIAERMKKNNLEQNQEVEDLKETIKKY